MGHTFAAFALTATGSSTTRIPFASFRSWAVTRWEGLTEAPRSVVLMYGSIIFSDASLGMLDTISYQSDGLRMRRRLDSGWGAIPILQRV